MNHQRNHMQLNTPKFIVELMREVNPVELAS